MTSVTATRKGIGERAHSLADTRGMEVSLFLFHEGTCGREAQERLHVFKGIASESCKTFAGSAASKASTRSPIMLPSWKCALVHYKGAGPSNAVPGSISAPSCFFSR